MKTIKLFFYGVTYSGTTDFYEVENGNYFIGATLGRGAELTKRIYMDNNGIKEEVIDDQMNSYGNKQIQFVDISDLSLIDKMNGSSKAQSINEKPKSTTISNSEAISIGDNLYKKALASFWGTITADFTQDTYETKGGYELHGVEEVKKVYSEKAFNKFLKDYGDVRLIDGKYYGPDYNMGSNPAYIGNELNIDSIEDNKIVFKSIEKYNSNGEMYTGDVSTISGGIDTKENRFVIIKENGEWKVDEFILPN